jgi:hypothetical protein
MVRGSHPWCPEHPHRHLWCLDTPFVCLHLEILSSVACVLEDFVYSNDPAVLKEAVIQHSKYSCLYSIFAYLICQNRNGTTGLSAIVQNISKSPVDFTLVLKFML